MIARLFRSRPRLDSKSPDDRRSAIEALSEQDVQKVQPELACLAVEDEDPGVRRLAITRLQREETLRELLADASLAGRAVERILELNAQGSCTGLAEEPQVLAARFARTDEPETLAGRLLESGGHGLLIDAILGAGREKRASLLTLQALDRMEVLQELERRSRDRDKNANRFARTRLDEIRSQSAAAAELAGQIEERLNNLEKSGDSDAQLERERRSVLLGRVEQDIAELTALNQALVPTGAAVNETAVLADRYQALKSLEAAPPQRVEAAQPEAPIAVEPAAEPTAASTPTATAPGADFDALTARFKALDEALASDTSFDALATERQTLTDLWLATADHTPPDEAQHQVFEQVSHRFQQLSEANRRLQAATFPNIDPATLPDTPGTGKDSDAWQAAETLESTLAGWQKTLKHIGWPDWAAVPEAIGRQHALAETAKQRLAEWRQNAEKTLSELGASLEKLDALIDAGELKPARAEAGRIRKALKSIPERSAVSLHRQLARASARLNELSDWQTFATTPKREALLAAMTEIADAPLTPPDQADRIKSLRKDWNALGPAGRSDDHKLLDAFNEAAERAFEPCRNYFAEQAEVRAANLAAREAICASLAEYLDVTDWSNADYKAAERIMRTARDEWRAHHPVDRSAGKALEERFEALQADLHEHIKAEWDRNLAAKQQIVEEAQALLASEESVADQVEGAKRLQQRWKLVGTTPRRPDQTLWREFRTACDAIFEHRDSAKQSEAAEVEANRASAEQLLAAFRTRLDDVSDPIGSATLRDFQNAYAELPSLPDRLARALDRDRDELVRTAQQMLRDQQAAETILRLENLKTQDAEVSALEQRQQTGETVTFTPPDPIFANRCRSDATPVDIQALTRIVIEAEIAAGLESEETELRMALQVEMMNAGRGREALEATPEDLTSRWCELGPKDVTADPLRDRLFTAIAVLLRG